MSRRGGASSEASGGSSQQSQILATAPEGLQNTDGDDGEGSTDNEDQDMETSYGDMHRLVLQGVMAAGFLDTKGVKKLLQESCKQLNIAATIDDPFKYVQKVVREINERIKAYGMMIRSATCEITGRKFYILLITHEKPIMKLQTYFTKVELELFQKIMDSLLRKHKYYTIPFIECINMGGDLNVRGFGKADAEDFVERMISLQYFTKMCLPGNENEFEITLGFRTIREFEPIFEEMYKDCFTTCCLCKSILLNGLKCPKCSAVIHRGCLKRYIGTCKMCITPGCKAQWRTMKSLVVRTREGGGEPMSRNTSPGTRSASSQDNSQSQTPSPSKKGTRQATGASSGSASSGGVSTARAGGAAEVDMPILELMVSPGSSTQGKGTVKRKNIVTSTSTQVKAEAPPSKVQKPGPASSKVAGGRARRSIKFVESDSN